MLREEGESVRLSGRRRIGLRAQYVMFGYVALVCLACAPPGRVPRVGRRMTKEEKTKREKVPQMPKRLLKLISEGVRLRPVGKPPPEPDPNDDTHPTIGFKRAPIIEGNVMRSGDPLDEIVRQYPGLYLHELNITEEQHEKMMKEWQEIKDMKIKRSHHDHYDEFQLQEHEKLIPKGWNYTHNPGVLADLRYHSRTKRKDITLEDLELHSPEEWSSEEIDEQLDDVIRGQFKDMAKPTQKYEDLPADVKMLTQGLDESRDSQEIYNETLNDFLNETEWLEVQTPKWNVPAFDLLGEQVWNDTFHHLLLLNKIKNLTVREEDFEEYRYRWSNMPNDVVHDRFQIPEDEFYRWMLGYNLTCEQLATFAAGMRNSIECDFIEDICNAGVAPATARQIQKDLKNLAERSVDFFPGEKLEKRKIYKRPEQVIGKPRYPELRTARDGWWYHYRWHDYNPVKRDYDVWVVLQFTVRWRDYEWVNFREYEAQKAKEEEDEPLLDQCPYNSMDYTDYESYLDGMVHAPLEKPPKEYHEHGNYAKADLRKPKEDPTPETYWKPTLNDYFDSPELFQSKFKSNSKFVPQGQDPADPNSQVQGMP